MQRLNVSILVGILLYVIGLLALQSFVAKSPSTFQFPFEVFLWKLVDGNNVIPFSKFVILGKVDNQDEIYSTSNSKAHVTNEPSVRVREGRHQFKYSIASG